MWIWKKNQSKTVCSVSPAFLILLCFFAMFDRAGLLIHILLAAMLHESGHLAVLYLMGGKVQQFHLGLFGARLQIQNGQRISYPGEWMAVMAGPVTNLLCAALIAHIAAWYGWEEGYLASGIHALLGLFNLLPIRMLDGGRGIELLLSWAWGPILAERVIHWVSIVSIGLLLCVVSGLQSAAGIQIPLFMAEMWFIVCWCMETGIVKQHGNG